MAKQSLCRCGWVHDDPIEMAYHDREWGVPLHDDQNLFEFLVLEGFQAGLSWITILRKREHFRQAFDHFDPVIVARYDTDKYETLMQNPGIVRNRLKIQAATTNAQAFLTVQAEFGSFDAYLWDWVNGTPIQNAWPTLDTVPARTVLSDAFSKDLKKRGFKFVGSVICYAFMQAIGMVNDHTVDCFRYRELSP
ncbi:MAG: DNA-3-methyladenine glycosylase I [Leptolyngbya sp. SIOISBB]|nr:DNA-3-methyladenine glycosylase I [Leptolyngbya sp. SIOISBB]